jgi:hypothetical protein
VPPPTLTLAVVRAAAQRLRGVRPCALLPAPEEAAVLRVLRVWQTGASGWQDASSASAHAAAQRQRFFGVPRLCAPPSAAALEIAARTAALASPHCLNDTGAYMRAWRQAGSLALLLR